MRAVELIALHSVSKHEQIAAPGVIIAVSGERAGKVAPPSDSTKIWESAKATRWRNWSELFTAVLNQRSTRNDL